jgi:Mrp family chromosome partitioning ATPase
VIGGGRRRPPVLGRIPAERSDSRRGGFSSAELEALEAVHEGLEGAGVVLVSGEDGMHGRLALGLAAIATAAGRRAALVECDLARPALAESLGLSPAPGLHELLAGSASPREILQPLVLAGPASAGAAAPLTCVLAGSPAEDPVGLLASEGFAAAIENLRASYEPVVLAGPSFERPHSLPWAAEHADATVAYASGRRLPKELPIRFTGVVQRS